MWPRRLDGSFQIPAIVDHLLALLREERVHPRPDLEVASRVPAVASGLHVIHAAAVLLGAITPELTPEVLVWRVTNEKVRHRIEAHLGKGGLTDGDLRALGDALGLFLGRCMTFDGIDPFEPVSRQIVSVLRLGQQRGMKIVLRYVLLLDRRRDRLRLADPGGGGVVEMKIWTLEAAWRLGALGGRGWLATVSPARSGTESAPSVPRP
jgi:hypothetical protein